MKIVDLINAMDNVSCAVWCEIHKGNALFWRGNICQMSKDLQNMTFNKFYIVPDSIKFGKVGWISFYL